MGFFFPTLIQQLVMLLPCSVLSLTAFLTQKSVTFFLLSFTLFFVFFSFYLFFLGYWLWPGHTSLDTLSFLTLVIRSCSPPPSSLFLFSRFLNATAPCPGGVSFKSNKSVLELPPESILTLLLKRLTIREDPNFPLYHVVPQEGPSVPITRDAGIHSQYSHLLRESNPPFPRSTTQAMLHLPDLRKMTEADLPMYEWRQAGKRTISYFNSHKSQKSHFAPSLAWTLPSSLTSCYRTAWLPVCKMTFSLYPSKCCSLLFMFSTVETLCPSGCHHPVCLLPMLYPCNNKLFLSAMFTICNHSVVFFL